MPTVKLASQRLNISGPSGQLSPVLFSAGAGGSIRAPQVSVNAGQVQNTRPNSPGINIDTTLRSVGQFANVWTRAAFNFQERESQASADQAVLQAEADLNKIYYGDKDNSGYRGAAEQVAVKSYGSYADRVKEVTAASLNSLDERTKAKAVVRLSKLQQGFTAKGASHKATQFEVWQKNIAKEQKILFKANGMRKSGDVLDFSEFIATELEDIDTQLTEYPEQATAVKQAFVDEMFGDVIKAWTTTGDFKLAEEYINLGAQLSVDPNILATRIGQFQSAIKASNSAIVAKSNADAKAYEINAARQASEITRKAMDARNPEILKGITDPFLRSKAFNAMQNLAGELPDDPTVLNQANLDAAGYADFPQGILTDRKFDHLTSSTRNALYQRFERDERTGLSVGLKEQSTWIKSILPPATTPEGKWDVAEINATYARVMEQMRDAGYSALKDERSPAAAMWQVRQDILGDRAFDKNFSKVKILRDNLQPIRTLKGGDLLSLDQWVGDPEYVAVFNKTAKRSAKQLLRAYNVDTSSRKAMSASVNALANSSSAHASNFRRDLGLMKMQLRYYKSQFDVKNIDSVRNQ